MLRTERLRLRSFEERDAEDLFSYLSDPEVVRFEPYGTMTLDECRVEAARRAYDERFWAVETDGKVIGNLFLSRPDDQNTAELGFVFSRAYQRKGYATEAAKCLLKYAFAHMGLHRVIAMCDAENPASWHLMERLGMRREGCFRKNTAFWKDERGKPIWKDTLLYAILEEEFDG